MSSSTSMSGGAGKTGALGQGGADSADKPLPSRVVRGNSHNDTRYDTNANYDGYFNRATDLALGEYASVAIQDEGSVWAWGTNGTDKIAGTLGDFTTANKFYPVQVGRIDDGVMVVDDAYLSYAPYGDRWARRPPEWP